MGNIRRRFLTPNSPLPGGNYVLKLIIPKDIQFIMHFLGALTDLAEEINWEKVGDMTPEQAAEYWSRILAAYEQEEETIPEVGMPLGSIVPYTGSSEPTNWLFCNGGTIAQEDYPELTAVIDSSYKDTINGIPIIRIPYLNGKFLMGEDPGTYDIRDEGGEAAHVLTVGEMPQHNHTIPRTSNVVSAGGSRYSPEGSQSAAVTGNAGGNEPHNNLPPFVVTRFIMRVK